MSPGIDMGDANAWDDSLLISSWDDAVAEYKKYHSIQKSGKKLEDVLTEKELKELRKDHAHLLDVAIIPLDSAATSYNAEEEGAEMDLESSEEDHSDSRVQPLQETRPAEPSQKQQSTIPTSALPNGSLDASMPHALLGSVQDENLKNIMISWYYAGYYTGLHAGQQQVPRDAAPNQ